MSIEQRINYQLNKFPLVKRVIKRAYQSVCYAASKKIESEGNIVRLSPNDKEYEYFFGYYDKSPWDATGRYIICMRAKDTWSEPDPVESADILLIDTLKSNSICKIATTHTWNVQQGCMAQWLGPDYKSHILYNDIRQGKYCSIVLNIEAGVERVLPMPAYTVSADGKIALSLDFSRLHSLQLCQKPPKVKLFLIVQLYGEWILKQEKL